MTEATSKGASRASASESAAAPGRDRTSAIATSITPAAALARHLEWLEFALAAARSEEAWRAGRLQKATNKSRDKRTARLADVRDEIAELSALIAGIRGLQAPSRARATASGTAAATAKSRTTKRAANALKPAAGRRVATKPAGPGTTRRRATGSSTDGPA